MFDWRLMTWAAACLLYARSQLLVEHALEIVATGSGEFSYSGAAWTLSAPQTYPSGNRVLAAYFTPLAGVRITMNGVTHDFMLAAQAPSLKSLVTGSTQIALFWLLSL